MESSAPHNTSADGAKNARDNALRVYRPLVEKAVAALGMLFTHQLAYLFASLAGLNVAAASDHGHLSLQWAVVTPLAIGAVCGFIVWQLKGLGFRSDVSARHLGALIAGFFLIQETVEGVLGGQSLIQTLTHPAIIAGLLIAPVVGWLLSRFLAEITELAARFLAGPGFVGPPRRPALIPVPVRCTPGRAGSPSRPRAPPSRLRI